VRSGVVLYAVLMLAAAADPAVAPSAASATVNPRAVELFDRDWVLNQWARRMFDALKKSKLAPLLAVSFCVCAHVPPDASNAYAATIDVATIAIAHPTLLARRMSLVFYLQALDESKSGP